MHRTVWLLAGLAVLALVVGLWGCSSTNDAAGAGVDTAVKPPPAPTPQPPPDSSGVIAYWDMKSARVWELEWNGSNLHQLSSTGTVWDAFDLSSQGLPRFLVFIRNGVPNNLFSALETGDEADVRPLLPPGSDYGVGNPAVSPDGTRLAINAPGGLSVADISYADGYPSVIGTPTVVCTPGALYGPSWSPDGSRLVFSQFVGDQEDLFVVAAQAGQTAVNITNSTLRELDPCWSSTNDRIAFPRQVVSKAGTTGYQIYTVDANGSGLAAVTTRANTETVWNGCPTWSPDGTQIAFKGAKKNTGDRAIFRTAADGTNLSLPITAYLAGQSPWNLRWRQ